MQIRLALVFVVAALIAVPSVAWAQQSAATTPDEPVTVEEFRNALVDYLAARAESQGEAAWSAGVTSSGTPLTADVLALDYEQLELWMNDLPDPRRYVDLLRRANPSRATSDPRIVPGRAPVEPTTDSQSFIPFVASVFDPPYPTDSGDYAWFLDRLQAFGMFTSLTPEDDRCDAEVWAGYYRDWWDANIAAQITEKGCITGGCDPIGPVCGAACLAYATALAVEQDFELKLLLCDAHNANVDGAEIEAAFRNSARALKLTGHVHDDLEDHESALSTHDTHIDGDLAAHDANIDGDLAAHDGRLTAHDVNIDGDLSAHDARLVSHDTAMQNAVNGVQSTIDDEVELRSVHLQVLEIVNGKEYMVVATESGLPVDVSFGPVQVFATRSGVFEDAPGAGVSPVETGIYLVEMDAQTARLGNVFRVRVEHDDTVDHHGQVVFHRDGLTVVGP